MPDPTVSPDAREAAAAALADVELARTEVVRPANGTRPYSYVTFAGARIEFQQEDAEVRYHNGSPVYDAATDKAAAQAQRINDLLFDVATNAVARFEAHLRSAATEEQQQQRADQMHEWAIREASRCAELEAELAALHASDTEAMDLAVGLADQWDISGKTGEYIRKHWPTTRIDALKGGAA